jgi:hypothetical protein
MEVVPLDLTTTAYTDAWNRQPDPMERVSDRRPTNEQWVVVAAAWQLAMWSPEQARLGVHPGVRKTKSREEQQWPEPPPMPEIAS